MQLPSTSGFHFPACNLRICRAVWQEQLTKFLKSITKQIFSQTPTEFREGIVAQQLYNNSVYIWM